MIRMNSPLRYPGGKACLYDLTASILRLNNLGRAHYAEPYAGGCGLALSLLYGGHAADVHLNDVDQSVWAFWHCVLNETDRFIELVRRTPLTIDEWHRQREIHRDSGDTLKLGFAAFFLNRTNRSGVIKDAGVIGGLTQTGDYKMDCRFNRVDLIKRIVRIKKYRDRIHLTNLDALDFLQLCEQRLPQDSLLFIDPPYFKKGASLYTSFYRPADHAAVARKVIGSSLPWVVTYDDAPEIRDLYQSRRQYCFDIKYSLNAKRVGTELLIASKGLRLPTLVKERQVNRPRSYAA
jgi:DNA adenine methylase